MCISLYFMPGVVPQVRPSFGLTWDSRQANRRSFDSVRSLRALTALRMTTSNIDRGREYETPSKEYETPSKNRLLLRLSS